MTPEEMQAGEILPQVGEIAAHIGKQYECTLVEWDREEDEITVTYRRRYADSHGEPLPDPFKGQRADLMVVDETYRLPYGLFEATTARFKNGMAGVWLEEQNPPEWDGRDGG